jgi:hypothetical protein
LRIKFAISLVNFRQFRLLLRENGDENDDDEWRLFGRKSPLMIGGDGDGVRRR